VLWLVTIYLFASLRISVLRWKTWPWALIGVTAVLSLIALVEEILWIVWQRLLPLPAPRTVSGTLLRAQATFYNANLLAVFLEMTLPFLVFWPLHRQPRGGKQKAGLKGWFLLPLALAEIALLYTYSRVAFYLIVLFAFALLGLSLGIPRMRPWRNYLLVRALVIGGIALLFAWINPNFQRRLTALPRDLHRENIPLEGSFRGEKGPPSEILSLPENRWAIWKASWELFRWRPLLGIGVGNFPRYVDKWHSHSFFLEILVSVGSIGAFLFLILGMLYIRRFVQVIPSLITSHLRLAVFWGVGFFFLHSLLDYLLGSLAIAFLSAFLMGLLINPELDS